MLVNSLMVPAILLPLLIAVPLAGALIVPLAARIGRRAPETISLLITVYLLLTVILLYFFRPFNQVILFKIGGVVAPLGVDLVLDGLSHLLLLSIAIVSLPVICYAVNYLDHRAGREKFYALCLLMLTGMIGVVLAGELFSLFVFLEVAVFSSYALVAFGAEAEGLAAAIRYLVIGTAASLMILLGLGLVYLLAGTSNLAQVSSSFPAGASQLKGLITALLLAGFGLMAAIVPFHTWLPDADTPAPAPVSALLSGVLIKALGIYAIIRLLFNVFGISQQISCVLLVLGIASILIGALLALGQWDFKRLLAYHSISQIGYVVLGLGLATPLGIMGGLFHLFNHAIFKALLFLNAGSVEQATGTRDLKQLGGLARKMPVTAGTSLIASLSVAGLPPFNGFWSKLFIIVACIQAGKFWFAFAAVIGSILTLSSFLKVQKYGFFDELKKGLENVKEAPWLMGSAMIVLALLCFLVGVCSPLVISYVINPAVVAVANGTGYGRMIAGVR